MGGLETEASLTLVSDSLGVGLAWCLGRPDKLWLRLGRGSEWGAIKPHGLLAECICGWAPFPTARAALSTLSESMLPSQDAHPTQPQLDGRYVEF